MESEEIAETAGPPPGIRGSGQFDERPGDRAHRSHGRADWLIKDTLRGQGLYLQPDLSILVGPGDLTMLAPGAYQDYSVPPGGAWEFLWAHFVPRPTWTGLLKLPEVGRGLHRLSVASPAARERIEAAFRRLQRDALGGLHPLGEELARESRRAVGRLVAEIDVPPRDGDEVTLAIDQRLQFLAHRSLKAAVEAQHAKAGSLVVLDAKTGEVLALVNQPDYNPNNRAAVTGRILFEGRDLLTLARPEMRRLRGAKLAMVFQEPMTALNPVMRVGEQIAEAPLVRLGQSRRAAKQRRWPLP